MAEPAAKKPRRGLPELDSMEAQRSADKQCLRAVKSAYDDMKRANLTGVKRLEKLGDEVKLLWLMAKHGMVAVLNVIVAMRTVPASLTENQARKYVLRGVEGTSDAEAIYDFLLSSCASDALEKIASSMKMEVSVLGPPALECCGCRKPLVSYLTTTVTLWCSASGESRTEMQGMQFDFQSHSIRE